MFRKHRMLFPILIFAAVIFGGVLAGGLKSAVGAEERSEYSDLELLTDVLTIVSRSYVEEVSMKDLIYGAINGMLASLDPHSSFMPPEMYKEMQVETTGEFGGLGMEVTIRDGILTIVSPIEDTPAFRAGLKAEDRIVKIGDKPTNDLSIVEAVDLMRGPPGTDITIFIMREGFERPREISLVRENIKIKSVKGRMLEDGFAYAHITQFQERTADDLHKLLKDLRGESNGALAGLILDLRNNPGGLLDQAVKVSDTFLAEGLIVYTDGREEGSRMRFEATATGTEPTYPIVALINGGSASASEIVAGALQDHGRAVLLGTQTFGKGSVQTIIPLSDDSGLRLTTARYYTPNGTSIQARGITPDIPVPPGEIKSTGDGSHFREKDLKNHFEKENASDGKEPPNPKKKFLLSPQDREDFQLMRALDLLKGLQIFQDKERRPAA